MDKYFINKQNEIVERLLGKSNDEIMEFLGMENNDTGKSIIQEFKFNLKTKLEAN